MLNYNETVEALEVHLSSTSKKIPLIIGECGIGKSSIPKEIVTRWSTDEFKVASIMISGSILKEGELGGVPIATADGYNVYTKFHKLVEAVELAKTHHLVIIMIDEVNRADLEVQKEFMHILLEKEINGFKLPSNCKMIAAGNPEESEGGFDYQTITMNPALKDRFTIWTMTSHLESWLEWANNPSKCGLKEKNIINEVQEFLAIYPEHFHLAGSTDNDIFPTPRSWESASDILSEYFVNEDKISHKVLRHLLEGDLGSTTASLLVKFIEDKEEPMITAEELLDDSKSIKNKNKLTKELEKGNPLRITILSNRIVTYLSNLDKIQPYMAERITSELIEKVTKDLQYALINKFFKASKKIQNAFMSSKNKRFSEIYIENLKAINNL